MGRFGKTISKKTFDLDRTYLRGFAGQRCGLKGEECGLLGLTALDACLGFVIHSPDDALDAVGGPILLLAGR